MHVEYQEVVELARRTAETLYRGEAVPHRSCGVAVAETFGLNPVPYMILRRGGLTGESECGAVRAGEMALCELLADGQYVGALPPALAAAMDEYRRLFRERLSLGACVICNFLTTPQGDFAGQPRKDFCTSLASGVAALVAELALKHGASVQVRPADLG
ncbi:MAG: hypothetical protein HYU66_18700 [Armatimonadetes bacterium]|nr:hypothetical protein [Armatimonadota bacterium]